MSRLRIAGIIAALVLTGCGDDSGVTEGTTPFKSGDVEQLAPLREQMIQNIKSKAYTKRPVEDGKTATESKPQEKKP